MKMISISLFLTFIICN